VDFESRSAIAAELSQTIHRWILQYVNARFAEGLTQLANTFRDQGAIEERERFIDATFVSAKGAATRRAFTSGQRRENSRACWSAWASVLGQYACGQSSRSHVGSTQFQLLT
jgi:hypothetical protein